MTPHGRWLRSPYGNGRPRPPAAYLLSARRGGPSRCNRVLCRPPARTRPRAAPVQPGRCARPLSEAGGHRAILGGLAPGGAYQNDCSRGEAYTCDPWLPTAHPAGNSEHAKLRSEFPNKISFLQGAYKIPQSSASERMALGESHSAPLAPRPVNRPNSESLLLMGF